MENKHGARFSITNHLRDSHDIEDAAIVQDTQLHVSSRGGLGIRVSQVPRDCVDWRLVQTKQNIWTIEAKSTVLHIERSVKSCIIPRTLMTALSTHKQDGHTSEEDPQPAPILVEPRPPLHLS